MLLLVKNNWTFEIQFKPFQQHKQNLILSVQDDGANIHHMGKSKEIV